MEHHHTIWQWLYHNSGMIIVLWIPAFCGWLNCIIAFFKVWGLTKPAEFCGKLEDSLKAVVDTWKAQNQTGGTK